MPDNRPITSRSRQIVAELAQIPRIHSLGPIAARLVYSLRLIALHERARRDPIPELAMQLTSVDIAAKALALAQVVAATWPENIHVSRFCCHALTHDEATVGALIEAGNARDRQAFDAKVQGLIRPARIETLWQATLDLITAEMRAA